jgi:MATE family multidrug resistance protein
MNAPLVILLFLSPLNMALQYLLVWNSTFSLGFKGAPIASSITYTIMAISMALYVKYVEGGKAWGGWSLKDSFDARELFYFLKLGLPGILMCCSEWWAFEVIALAAGLLGDDVLAAQTVVLNTCGMTFMIPFGVGIACTTVVGNELGALMPNRAKLNAQSALLLGFTLALFNAIFLFSIRNHWGYLWNSDPMLNSIIASILPLAALFQLSDAIGTVGAGVLRGIGKI